MQIIPSIYRRLWDVAFTGVPFGLFKIGGGLAALKDVHPAIGFTVILWGGVDILLNLLNVIAPRQVAVCALSNVGRWFDERGGPPWRERALLAVDTLLSFTIVSSMIWLERIPALPKPMPFIWMVAVIASLLGVGVERVWYTFRHREIPDPQAAEK